jgi:molybdate/tungstate transport system substrate-binding protein
MFIHMILFTLSTVSVMQAETPNCAPATNEQLIIYRAGSLTRAFQELEKVFTCQTGIQVKDYPMGSVDAGRQITAGGYACDLYAPADYLDIDLFMKPPGYADFNVVFAQGRMVLAYSAKGLAAKKLPEIATPDRAPFHPPASVPNAIPKWYDILTMPGVAIGGGNWFLDPGAYRAPMMFQLAAEYYKVPNLYNNLLQHLVIMGQNSGAVLGKQFDFQFTYEHNARAAAAADLDYRYVDLPDEINLSDPAKDTYYLQHAIVVLPGLGTSRSARTIEVPGAHVAWGITLLKDAPNKQNAIKFLQLLLGPEGTSALKKNGPEPLSAAMVSSEDFRNLPEPLRPLVREGRKVSRH